jgi:hypothetical protein
VELNDQDKELLKSMEAVRESASVALNARKELSLPIRQPLATMSVTLVDGLELSSEMLAILLSEINVKQIDPALTESDGGSKSYSGTKFVKSLLLDTAISDDLRVEGLARAIERLVQDMRKKTGLQVGETVNLTYHTNDGDLQKAMDMFDRQKTFVNNVQKHESDQMETFDIDGRAISLAILK